MLEQHLATSGNGRFGTLLSSYNSTSSWFRCWSPLRGQMVGCVLSGRATAPWFQAECTLISPKARQQTTDVHLRSTNSTEIKSIALPKLPLHWWINYHHASVQQCLFNSVCLCSTYWLFVMVSDGFLMELKIFGSWEGFVSNPIGVQPYLYMMKLHVGVQNISQWVPPMQGLCTK